MHTCKLCSFQTTNIRSYNGHIGNHHSGRIYQKHARCCSLLTRKEVSVQYLDKHEENYLKKQKSCPRCNKTFYSNNKFCSSSCAVIFTNKNRGPRSEETKAKISTSVKLNPAGWAVSTYIIPRTHFNTKDPSKWTFSQCKECNKTFEHRKLSKRKYCSHSCSSGKQGGYHPNSTRKTRTTYKGFQMDSGSERQFAELLDKHNIKWTKNSTIKFEYQPGKYYIPDFYLSEYDYWVEVKAKYYLRADDDLRWASVPNHEVIWYDNICLPSFI